MIITLARQRGSGAAQIGKGLAAEFSLPVYNLRELINLAKGKGLLAQYPEFFSEQPLNSLLSVISLTDSPKEVRELPQLILSQLLPADDFILIGRCGNVVYGNRPDCVRIFLSGAPEVRIENIMSRYDLPRKAAESKVRESDEKRRYYHEYYTGKPWGQADQYDLCLDSGKLGLAAAESFIKEYVAWVKRHMEQE